MIFGPLKRVETVPEQIAGILRRAILGGELGVGSRLPSEKVLSEQFETNRVSLRQALQILKAGGLIEGGQGKAWRVSDFRQSGGLHWLPDLFEVQGFTQETLDIIEDFLSIRTPVLQRVLGMAMKRMSAAQQETLRGQLDEIEQLVAEGGSTEALFLADLAWFEALLDASNSLLYKSVYRPFSDVYKRFSAAVVMVWQPPAAYPSELRLIQEAITEGESDRAQKLLTDYLEADADVLRELLKDVAASLSQEEDPLV